ncbi:uncharacterized protein LOC128515993 isoform X3 [Xyrichtys novacula]|uniref:Uncharacterized protein LOC128515993 isoform X3 n=1 Tax=Xyrichtys novacula TaxID=13765 RepID=A0AAV1H7U3_XYRNO|nr:uncharacterized protein LOC128515993 isoform X3 [Xyrichtys novacula]
MPNSRATYFTPAEQQLLMELYEEVKPLICKKGNTSTIIKEREKAWQTIADRLNAVLIQVVQKCPINKKLPNSQTVRALYAQYLQKQIALADVKIQLKSRKLQETELDLGIKRRTLRKLDLEIQKLEREVSISVHAIPVACFYGQSINICTFALCIPASKQHVTVK